MTARTVPFATALAILGAALWWRRHPSACPFSQRFSLVHPGISRERLQRVLRPTLGERVLEIGPGTGFYTLDIAAWVGPEGRVEIFDIQQEFLDHTVARADRRGLANVRPTQGDARSLPYEDASFDAAVLTAVLGEIPDRDEALREIRRVLRTDGRLVVGELFGDPHFTTFGSLRRRCAASGLRFDGRSGNWFAYFARFVA